MKAISDFIMKHGLALKLGGFAVAVTAGLVSIGLDGTRYKYHKVFLFIDVPFFDNGVHYPDIAIAVAFLGAAAHIVGRVAVAVRRRGERYGRYASDDDVYLDDHDVNDDKTAVFEPTNRDNK